MYAFVCVYVYNCKVGSISPRYRIHVKNSPRARDVYNHTGVGHLIVYMMYCSQVDTGIKPYAHTHNIMHE